MPESKIRTDLTPEHRKELLELAQDVQWWLYENRENCPFISVEVFPDRVQINVIDELLHQKII